jgi:hypothetical protein
MSSDKQEVTRVTRSKEDAKNSYDKMSKWYDQWPSLRRNMLL